MECRVASTKACCEKGSTNTRVGIGARVGIRASSSKDIFRLF